MFLFWKSLSRSVHEEHQEQVEYLSKSTQGPCKSLTVWRKSLIVSCNGFTVIDSDGNLVYRVDNYMGRPKELILMDGSGKSIFTMRRSKNLGLLDTWLVYRGEVDDRCTLSTPSEKPIFYVRKRINILHANPNVLAYVYRRSSDKRYAYMIEGSYSQRSCKVLDETKRVVAEIRRKDAIIGGISLGLDVFLLRVQAGLDPGFAMALVLLLDQMFS